MAITAINLADDLAFAVLDVAGGEKSFGESMAEFGAQSFVKVGTSLIGAGFSGTQNFDGLFTDAIGAGGFGGSVASTMSQGLTSIASSPLNAAVGAMDFSQMGTADFWSQDRFAAGMQAGVTGAFGQMATGFVGDMTEGMLAGDLTGFSQADSAAVNSVASLGGTAAQAGFEYMAFGSTSINILNTRDFGFAPNQAHGLFALTLDKDDGIGGAITGGGHGMSISTLNDAIAGWDAFVTQTRIRWYDATGGPEVAEGYEGNTSAAVAFRANYSFGDEAAADQVASILRGETTLRVGDESQIGLTTRDGQDNRVVSIMSLGMDGDVNSQLNAGLILQHEAHRDGRGGSRRAQRAETEASVTSRAHMAESMQGAFGWFGVSAHQQAEIDLLNRDPGAFSEYVGEAYEADADFWKLTQTEDGSWGWADNQSLTFDVSDLPEEVQDKVALRLYDEGFSYDTSAIPAAAMSGEILELIANGVAGAEPDEPGWFAGLFPGPRAAHANAMEEHQSRVNEFVQGTETFVEVSGIAADMMAGGVTNESIAQLDSLLVATQNSGLLIQNEARLDPFDPSDPIIYANEGDRTLLTSPQGYRSRTNSRGEPTNLYHQGADFAIYGSDWSRYRQGEVGVRSREETTLELDVIGAFGLRATATGTTIRGQYSHLHPNTVMDYLAVFGTSGVTASGSGLNGVPAGMRLGSIGNTGAESTGPHLDLITTVLVDSRLNRWELQDPLRVYTALGSHPESDWSQVYAGRPNQLLSAQNLMEMQDYEGRGVDSFMPWMDDRFMAPDAIDRAMELYMRQVYGLWRL